MHRQPGLAHAAGAGQGHQPVLGQQLPHLGQLGFAANEARQLHRKMVGNNAFGNPQRWEVVDQVGVAQLHHSFGARQITQRMGAQIGQPGIGGKPVGHQILGGARQQGLAPMPQIAQPRGAVDGRAGIVAFIAQLDFTGVHTDAQPDRRQRRSLQLQRAATASEARANAATKLSPSPCSTGRTPSWAAMMSDTV